VVSDGQNRHETVFDSQCAELTGKTKSSLFLAWCIATRAGVHCTGSGVFRLVDSFLLSARSFILCNFEIECLPETLICRSTFSTHSIRTTISYDRILAAASDKGNANFDTIEPASYLADWIGVWAVT